MDEIIAANKGLVYQQLHRFNMIDDQDAESLAFEALYKAIEAFNPNQGVKLSTYATVCIYNALGTHYRALKRFKRAKCLPLEDYMTTSSPVDTERDYIQSALNLEVQKALEALELQTPNETRKRILKIWIEHDFDITSIEVAKLAGVSQPYAHQTLAMFENKLRGKLKEWYYG